jgi:hypothetical protein
MSFKQFLYESIASPTNVDDSFIVGGVSFDNYQGNGCYTQFSKYTLSWGRLPG